MSSAAGAASGLLLTRYAGFADAAAAESASKLNVLLFITDQDRAIQHFPRGWVRQNLPGYSRLIGNGLSFTRAFTNACMCSPARSTLFSGYFPAQHGVKYTLEEEMTDPVKNPAGRAARGAQERCPGHVGRRLQRRLQGQVALL